MISIGLSTLLFNKEKFCNTNDYEKLDCIACPDNAFCENGKIIKCLNNRVLVKEKCV